MTNPYDKAGKMLAQPLAAIHAINAIDCHHLGLLDREPLGEYLNAILAALEALDPGSDSVAADSALSAAWKRWQGKNSRRDNRKPVSLAAFDSYTFGTVMAFGTFRWNNGVVADAALSMRSAGQTSKFAALRSFAEKNNQELLQAEVDEWIQCVRKLGESEVVPLVLEPTRKVWCTPVDKSLPPSAVRVRAKLGLDHLPREDVAASKTLIRLEFDKDELADIKKCGLKRPSLFDGPGHRFRALSLTEMERTCSSIKEDGMTVDMDTPQFDDGEAELTLRATDTANAFFRRWSVEALGALSGPHPRKEQHAEFADHLKSNKPANAVICSYRKAKDGIQTELASHLAM